MHLESGDCKGKLSTHMDYKQKSHQCGKITHVNFWHERMSTFETWHSKSIYKSYHKHISDFQFISAAIWRLNICDHSCCEFCGFPMAPKSSISRSSSSATLQLSPNVRRRRSRSARAEEAASPKAKAKPHPKLRDHPNPKHPQKLKVWLRRKVPPIVLHVPWSTLCTILIWWILRVMLRCLWRIVFTSVSAWSTVTGWMNVTTMRHIIVHPARLWFKPWIVRCLVMGVLGCRGSWMD